MYKCIEKRNQDKHIKRQQATGETSRGGRWHFEALEIVARDIKVECKIGKTTR